MTKYLVSAAIDFGTTYSGWAYSFRHDFERDPVKVCSRNWIGGTTVTQKAPTCVLIKPDGKTLDSFGYEAEKKFAQLASEERHNEWYMFRRFKMMLYNQKRIKRTVRLEDITGKKLLAKTVFALTIQYLKNDLMKLAGQRIGEEGLTDDDVLWVLTVPAIWDDAARQFMREAAEEAGIVGDHLLICLEPEAASLLCRHLPMERSQTSLAQLQPGTTYMVLDAGGGTIDITVHEVLPDNNLREKHKASGGNWGGTKVDEAFEKFLGDIFGKHVLQRFKEQHMEDYIELLWDFEIKKREVSSNKDTRVSMRFGASFSDLLKEMTGQAVKESVTKSKYKEALTVTSDKVRIDADVMRSFFISTIKLILDHVAELLTEQNISNCSAIIMAGGFSESLILQEKIKERFGGMRIIIPDEPGLAVLKGAVINGHNPDLIAERVCRFTYGTKISHTASKKRCVHPPTRQEIDPNGDLRCCDLFEIFVTAGQTVKRGDDGDEKSSYPVNDDQVKLGTHIYSSSSPNPIFVTEPGCTEIGHFRIDIPDKSLGRHREFGTRFIFWGTEIKVKVEDKTTGETTSKYVDFLG